MYLHLGENTVIRTENILGVFDLDNSTRSWLTRNYLKRAQKEKKVVNVSFELPKAFVVCLEGNKEIVYISQIASSTILKRLEKLNKVKGGERTEI